MPDFAITQAWNCGKSRFPRKMLLEQAGPVKNATFMEDASHLPATVCETNQLCLFLLPNRFELNNTLKIQAPNGLSFAGHLPRGLNELEKETSKGT